MLNMSMEWLCSKYVRSLDTLEYRTFTIVSRIENFCNCTLSYFYSVEHVRYCDSCDKSQEVCVALTEDIPVCHKIQDHLDPTGCGGLCILNSQVCLRIDTDAFKYVS